MANASPPQETGLLSRYSEQVAPTDVLDPTDLRSVQHGLFGEVGGIMSAAKKNVREGKLFLEYSRAAEEEFGDTLWYLAALCRRRGFDLEAVFGAATSGDRYTIDFAANDLMAGSVAPIDVPRVSHELDIALVALGEGVASLLNGEPRKEAVIAFASRYLDALHATGLTFASVMQANLNKARGAFLEPESEDLVDFDATFQIEERIPAEFRIRIDQRASGKSYLQWNGVFIGDPLTDNIADADGYRFHDVFHLANAAILHWSPVVRALIKQKRKSDPKYDEEQDGGRAIVVEEGVTAWLFARAKYVNYYEDANRVSLGTLKTVQEFVAGYEVEQCPLKLWERSILQGYAVFRAIRAANGGWVIGNRASRSLRFEPLETAS